MAWSEIKYALNSSLGTSNFESLDKKLDRIEKILDDQRTLRASNETYVNILTTEQSSISIPANSEVEAQNYVKINVPGTVRVITQGKSTFEYKIRIKNAEGTEIATQTATGSGGNWGTSTDISVNKGDELHIFGYAVTRTSSINTIRIGAVVVDAGCATVMPVV